MRATFIRCFLILVLLALPVTDAIAQPPTPEATPSPAPTATPIPQATGPTRIGSFDWSNLADFAALAV
ncbi:MAG: hypothetical protein MUP04_01360, partial [Anaerolineae bacterium]|nr:hypothetical protein [Anaerolineae bacterium]